MPYAGMHIKLSFLDEKIGQIENELLSVHELWWVLKTFVRNISSQKVSTIVNGHYFVWIENTAFQI